MKCLKIFRVLVLAIILPLLLVAFPVISTYAAARGITFSPEEGEIGDWIEIHGYGFDANEIVSIYFSSDEAEKGDSFDKVTAYEYLVRIIYTNADGNFDASFIVPTQLTDGEVKEDVHGNVYYVYVTSYFDKRIRAVARFIVIGGEIELDPEKGSVGTEVEISGKRFGKSQKIIIEYDGDDVDIASGDKETDSDGKFTCTIIIPESTVGNHTITVTDESGNKPEAEFSVKPKITIDPTSATVRDTVKVSGTGFADREYITITFDGYAVITDPIPIKANHKGSFSGSFLVPSYAGVGSGEVRASDGSFNMAKAPLTILATPAGISLRPATSLTSPGHVGMELTVDGTGFIANTMVTITYSNDDEVITVATTTADANGNFFSVPFTVPPSLAGSHTVTATDDTNSVTSVFTMESEAPLMPALMLPKVAATAEAETYFDWQDVTDPSGITYVLQIGADGDFATIVLEKKELADSEYTLTEEEKLESTEKEAPYYWRVKAIDGAFNESEWTTSRSFYVGFSWTSMPTWATYIWIVLGVVLLVILGLWVRRRITK